MPGFVVKWRATFTNTGYNYEMTVVLFEKQSDLCTEIRQFIGYTSCFNKLFGGDFNVKGY